jgi:outer membrane protein OmpA-like peptidoglycan-associated protein
VVLNFQFGRSELTEEAKDKLATAISIPKANTRLMSIALEGHADWIGPEGYNERLGLARAESVRRYMAEQLQIPADQISVVSYGETSPSAPNTTREGRAHNRRVVIKVGA